MRKLKTRKRIKRKRKRKLSIAGLALPVHGGHGHHGGWTSFLVLYGHEGTSMVLHGPLRPWSNSMATMEVKVGRPGSQRPHRLTSMAALDGHGGGTSMLATMAVENNGGGTNQPWRLTENCNFMLGA
jgi:hypothetical protein